MEFTIECKRCDAIYHVEVKFSTKKPKVRVKCPFCKRNEKIEVGKDDE